MTISSNAKTHTNKYAKSADGGIAKWLLEQTATGCVIHWVFQGILYADRTERWFKIGLDLILTLILGLFFSGWMRPVSAWISAFLCAHTLNFIFNAQLWVLLKHYGLVRNSYQDFETYIEAFRKRVERQPSIQYAAVYGSYVRGEWKPSSDLDVRLVRRAGLLNGLVACWFLMVERTRAFFRRFPLDIYVADNFESLERLRIDEAPLVLRET